MKNTVFVKRCEEYNRDQLSKLITEGMARLDYSPQGNLMVKPNVVFAYNTKVFGDMAYTPPPFVGASLVTLSKASGVKRIDMGENCAVGVPTRLCYKNAGYYDEMKLVRKKAGSPVGIFCMDEEPRDPIFIGGVVHDNLRISRKMARTDSKVYLPNKY